MAVVYFQTIDPYPCYHNFQKKILEKLFNERLDKLIDIFQLLNNFRYGVIHITCTIYLVEENTSSIDVKKVSIRVLIDLNKAFDTV